MPTVSVIDCGIGNLRSIKTGLEKVGANVLITHNVKEINESDAVVLPGVGAFAPAIKNLRPLADPLKKIVNAGKFLFGICLGLQLLFTRSSEGGSHAGLDFISGHVIKIPNTVKIPHIGWNLVEVERYHPLLESIANPFYAYFVHSYFPQPLEQNISIATTFYGISFSSMMAKQNLLATQFHPEKSGINGLKILKNFIEMLKR